MKMKKKLENAFWKYAPSILAYSLILAVELGLILLISWLIRNIITFWR